MNRLIVRNISAFVAVLGLLLSGNDALWAQTTVTGTVYDTAKPAPLAGATVVVQDKSVFAMTDNDGKFSISATEGDVLVVQFMGYLDEKVTVGPKASVEVVLMPDSEQLSESIVTALGLKREKRSLGYAATDVSGENLNMSRNSNWLGGLEGKVAGIQFNKGSGPIGSANVLVRGETSLEGGSSALFVIDGIPMTSGRISNASGSGYTNQDNPIDFGDGASDLNPEDIESITVLKGAAATALYGSRAGNGAIIITTKGGRTERGIGVTVSSSFTADCPGYWPDFQTEYGPGSDLGLDEYNIWQAAINPEGMSRHYSRYSYGEPFGDGTKMRYQVDGMNWETKEAVKTPWRYHDDWYTGIFRTGTTFENSIAIEGSNGKGTSARLSVKDTRNKWILPNTGYTRQSVSLSVTSQIAKFIKLTAKVNYYRTDSDNMPSSGYSNNSVAYQLTWNRTNVSMSEYAREYFEGRWNKETFSDSGWLIGQENYYNPYRVLYEYTNTMDKDRVFGNIGLSFNIWKNKITLDIKSGIDINNDFRTQRKPYYTYNYPQGWYREQSNFVLEANTDFMLRYTDSWLQDRLTLTAGFGGNNMTYNRRSWKYTIDKLDVEGVYTADNYPAGTIPEYSAYRSKKIVNSLYGIVSLGWDDWVYLDITARNDWSSTLAKNHWSYFYPSVSMSFVLDKAFKFQERIPWFTFLKVRASWANVGKDTDPYSLDYPLTTTDWAGGYRLGATYPKYDLGPENVATWEVGLEAKFLKNRIGFDVALYQSDVTNQIYSVPTDYMTGAKYYTSNIGLIRSRGIEISAHFVPVKIGDWRWDISINASRSVSKLLSMYDGWDPEAPHQQSYGTTIGSRLFVYDYIGRQTGELWGKGLAKAPEGAYYIDENGNQIDCSGKTIIDAKTGLPSFSDDLQYLGNVNPKWLGGFSTSLRWRDLTFSATFSAQIGGVTYSTTAAILGYQGKLKNTLAGRPDGLVADGVNVSTDTEGHTVYTPNTTITSDIVTYWSNYQGNRYNFEEYTYDNSFLKLKEVRLQYDFPKKLMQKTKVIQGITVAAYATNLFCVTNYPFYDPEVTGVNGATILRGIEAGSYPMNRSYGFNLKVRF